MNKILKIMIIIGIIALFLTSCEQLRRSLDVVGKESVASFDAVLKAIPDKVSANTNEDEVSFGWSLSAPDDSAWFIWSEDYSATFPYDLMIEFDAQPFLDAGLDPDRLPYEYTFYEKYFFGSSGSNPDSSRKMLVIGKKLGNDKPNYSGEPTALAAYEQIVKKYRDSIGYHTQLDHYGVDLGGGNMFEWAKDMSTNDKDIVFVLNPEPLIAAGVDPEAVEGWLFAKVTADIDGKPAETDKLLKPFNLK